MNELNFDNDAIVDPKDAEIAELRKQLEQANQRITHQVQQLDQAGDAIMSIVGHKVGALAESEIQQALDDFEIEIWDHQDAIGEMIDERLPDGLDDESRADDLKAAVSELLTGATIKIEIE